MVASIAATVPAGGGVNQCCHMFSSRTSVTRPPIAVDAAVLVSMPNGLRFTRFLRLRVEDVRQAVVAAVAVHRPERLAAPAAVAGPGEERQRDGRHPFAALV